MEIGHLAALEAAEAWKPAGQNSGLLEHHNEKTTKRRKNYSRASTRKVRHKAETDQRQADHQQRRHGAAVPQPQTGNKVRKRCGAAAPQKDRQRRHRDEKQRGEEPRTISIEAKGRGVLGSTHLRAPAAQFGKETPVGAQRLLPTARQCRGTEKEKVPKSARLELDTVTQEKKYCTQPILDMDCPPMA